MTPLSEFARETASVHTDTSSRVTSGLLTASLYALIGLVIWLTSSVVPKIAATPTVTANLLTDPPNKQQEAIPPPVATLIRPQAETAAPPVFTIASGGPVQAPAPLPATTLISPMTGGTTLGEGILGQAAPARPGASIRSGCARSPKRCARISIIRHLPWRRAPQAW